MKFNDRVYKNLVLVNCAILFAMALGAVVVAVKYRGLLKTKVSAVEALVESELASSRFLKSLRPAANGGMDVPEYSLKIKSEDLRRIQVQVQKALEARIMTDEMKEWYSAKFHHEGEEYDVRIRIRGDLGAHWAQAKKSWRVRFKKEKLFNGRRSIDLIVPFDKAYEVEHVAYDVGRELGLLVPDAGFAKVRINGVDFGAYTWIEKYGPEMLEKQGYPAGEIFREPNIWTQTQTSGLGIDNYSDFTGSIEADQLADPGV